MHDDLAGSGDAMTTEQAAEVMFNAYNEESPNPWKTFDGRDVPRWPDLSDQVRAKWCAAARAFLPPDAAHLETLQGQVDTLMKALRAVGDTVAATIG